MQPQTYFSKVTEALGMVDQLEYIKALEVLSTAKAHQAAVWIVGNGGSAATASHFANDLVKIAHVRAFAVPDMIPAILAFGNDGSWDRMFADYLKMVMWPGDVLVAISCSGKSENVVRAAVENWSAVIVLTGWPGPGNDLDNLQIAKSVLYARADDIRAQEDVHLSICHALAGDLR